MKNTILKTLFATFCFSMLFILTSDIAVAQRRPAVADTATDYDPNRRNRKSRNARNNRTLIERSGRAERARRNRKAPFSPQYLAYRNSKRVNLTRKSKKTTPPRVVKRQSDYVQPKAAQDWLNGHSISVAGLYELSNGKGMRILQNGDKFTIMIGSNYSTVMAEGTIEGNVLSSPNAKMRTFVSDDTLTKCGLSPGNNYYNAPVNYRLVLSSDGKTLTDESTMLPHALGRCSMTGGARFVTMTRISQ